MHYMGKEVGPEPVEPQMEQAQPRRASQSNHHIVTERRKVREAPGPHFVRVSDVWSAIAGIHIPAEKCVLMMAALKIVREAGGHEEDNVEDTIGYMSLIAEVRDYTGGR